MVGHERVRGATIWVLAILLIGSVSCSLPWTYREGGGALGLDEWQGQIVELNRDQGYMVVRSRERLLDYAFRITPKTEVSSPALERGQWVTVQYRRDSATPGPPAALRVVVVR